MEQTDKNLLDCAEREVFEETGLEVTVRALAWMREFFDDQKQQMNLETYWIASLKGDGQLNDSHSDMDKTGEVEQTGWFTEQEVRVMKVYPKIIQSKSFNDIQGLDSRYLPD